MLTKQTKMDYQQKQQIHWCHQLRKDGDSKLQATSHVPNDTEKTKTATSEQDNTENEVLHLKVPSGNATRPPPPNKYKIRKFQIDNIRYYSCMYCSKHFESIHDLNKHQKKHHPRSLAMCVIDSTTPQIH